MSRNRNSRSCECKRWHFRGDIPVGDARLMTIGEYFDRYTPWIDASHPYRTNYGHGWGYNYNASMVGYRWYTAPDGDGGANYSRPGYIPGPAFEDVPQAERYRMATLECPVCGLRYIGWYVQQPALPGEGVYELYDTSFLFAFNDEPSDQDRSGTVEWTDAMFVAACREFVERHGVRRLP
jgi:hypothetical protein